MRGDKVFRLRRGLEKGERVSSLGLRRAQRLIDKRRKAGLPALGKQLRANRRSLGRATRIKRVLWNSVWISTSPWMSARPARPRPGSTAQTAAPAPKISAVKQAVGVDYATS